MLVFVGTKLRKSLISRKSSATWESDFKNHFTRYYVNSLCFRKSSIDQLTVLCYRDRVRDGRREVEHSLIIEIHSVPEIDIGNSNKVSPSTWVRKKIGK